MRTPTSARPGWLLCLTLITFAIGTDDFIIAGLLPEIARDHGVSEATAGQLVTVFSVSYAIAAPPLAVATARFPRKRVVLVGLSAFALINLVTAFASTFAAVMVLRVAAALAAASISPAVFALAAQLARPARAGRAIGVVAAGLTVSLFLGVPLGSLLGSAFGWRSSFVAVAVFAGIVLVASAYSLPAAPGVAEAGLRAQLSILSRPAVMSTVVGTAMGASGGLLVYTYIAPITHALSGYGGPVLALFIAVVGVAGAVGTIVGGRLTDRWGADRALVAAFGCMVVGLVGLAMLGLAAEGAVPVWLTSAALALYGFAGWGFNPPMNARVLAVAGRAGTEALALNTSGLYVGIALGGAAGGAAVAAHGGVGAMVMAATLAVATLGVMVASVRRYPAE